MILVRSIFAIPNPIPGLIQRVHLHGQLDKGLTHKLTLICAPAGSGKTALLSDWAASRTSAVGGNRLQVAWVSLTKREDDPAVFWAHITAALDTIAVSPLPAWHPAHRPPGLDDLPQLIDLIDSHIPVNFCLVLDNFQTIRNTVIQAMINGIFDLQPAQMHLYISSRSEPPLSLAFLRACGQLNELRGSRLFFSPGETTAFLNQATSETLSAGQITTLHYRTEGWPAGLQLAVTASQEQTCGQDFSRSFDGSHRFVADYYYDQVFCHLSENAQQFLLRTAALHQLNGPLCSAVSGVPDCFEILQQLERDNLFVVPLDCNRRSYRYHRLFSSFLQSRLRHEDPAKWLEINRRAADWCEEHGDYTNAIRYATTAEEHELAVHWVGQAGGKIVNRDRFPGLLYWLRSLPDEAYDSQPALHIDHAWSLASVGMLDDVENQLALAEAKQSRPAMQGISNWAANRAHISLIRAFVARFKDLDQALLHSTAAQKEIVPGEPQTTCLATNIRGQIHMLKGESRQAEACFLNAIQESRQIEYSAGYINATYQLVNLRILEGRLREAYSLSSEAARQILDFQHPAASGIEQICTANVLYEWNRLAEARSRVNSSLEAALESGDFIFLSEGYLALARLERSQGNLEACAQHLRTVEGLNSCAVYPASVAFSQALLAKSSLDRGDLAAAEYWAQTCGYERSKHLHFLNEYDHMVLARVQHAQGKFQEARATLERLRPFTIAMGRNGRVIEIYLILAQVLQSLGSQDEALLNLEQALVLGMPEGFVRTFIDEGGAIENLLMRMRKSREFKKRNFALQHYVDELLQAFGHPHNNWKPAGEHSQPLPIVESLSQREAEVLKLIAQGCSYDAIARELVVAVSTVQWHVKNLYQKLDAHSATEAVAIARQLNLLD